MPKAKTAEGHFTKEGFTPSAPGTYAEMMVERINYSAQDGRKLSQPWKVTFHEKDWLQFLQFGATQGMSVVEILHLPAGWKEPEVIETHE